MKRLKTLPKGEISPQQVNLWKREFLAQAESVFTKGQKSAKSESEDIKLSMDGKGRAIDNVFIERLWRSVKYESIYLNPPDSGIDLYEQLNKYLTIRITEEDIKESNNEK